MTFLAENKKIYFNYEILEHLEAGMELLGLEVKSLRAGRGKLDGARIIIRGGEAYLLGATIPPYQAKNTPPSYDATRTRRLLLTKKEIGRLAGFEHQAGLTVVPISVYSKGRKLKISIGIVRGKKKYDKRESIKNRETKRSIERVLKSKDL